MSCVAALLLKAARRSTSNAFIELIMLATKARMRPIRLVIADRRPIVLQGFATLLAAERDFAIVASSLDGAGCLKAIRTLKPDLVLVEDGFSDVTASDLIAIVAKEDLPTRLVFYTASLAQGDLAAAIAAGACCAISMREEPERLLQSLRLVAPDRPAGKQQNGASSDNRLAGLTDLERKIMRLVACGMSNKQIARQLKVSTGTIKARLDHLSAQLEIKGRTQVSAFALSRLYGGIGALAALLYAALDDIQPASATAFGEASTDSFTVMTADGTTEVFSFKISDKKTTPASEKTAKSVVSAGRVAAAVTEMPGRNGKLVQSSTDIAPGTIALQTTSSVRAALGSASGGAGSGSALASAPGNALGSYGPFVMTAIGIWIGELMNGVAKAANFADNLTLIASTPGNGAGEPAALKLDSSADAPRDSFDHLAWWHPDLDHQSFSFDAPRSETIAGNGDAVQIIDADAREDGGSHDGGQHVGSGAIDAVIDHGSLEQVPKTGAVGNTEHDSMQATAQDQFNPGQSQRDLHVAEDGGAAAKPQDDQGSPETTSNDGQSQADLPSNDGTVLAAQHSEDAPPGDESGDAQSQREGHTSEDSSASAEHHGGDDGKPASSGNSGQSERDLHENAAENQRAGSSEHAANHQAADGAGPAQKATPPELGDSFHFRNENAASGAPSMAEVHRGQGPDFTEHGLHTAGHDGPPPVQASDLMSPADAEHGALDHASGAQHHLMHDLFV